MKKIIYPLFLLFFLLSACQDYEDLVKAEDQLIAFSIVDLKFNFKDVTTFSVNDSIKELYVDALGRETEKRSLATYQKDLVIKQMQDRGFTYLPLKNVTNENSPDLFIDLLYVENKYVQVLGYGWWYGDYNPYWYWYNDPFYPYYPYAPVSYTTITSYTAKTFVMDCFSFQDLPDHKHNAHNCFLGIVRGIADKYSQKEVEKYITQCFEQSPELNKN